MADGGFETRAALERLTGFFARFDAAAVAASGGVDSLTLAWLAHRHYGPGLEVFHAVSPAVPPAATARVRDHAARFGWRLEVVDAGEFDDPLYRSNPLDRCFHCKRNLYGALARLTATQIFSGTNLDDLDDFRPGLEAAARAGVLHPFVEAGVDKAGVRALAREHGLTDIADLPASPCLSSRVETGRPIDAAELRLANAVEGLVARETGAANVRCRIRASGVVVEIDAPELERLAAAQRTGLEARVAAKCTAAGLAFRGLAPYRRGSAFVGPGRG